MKYVYNMLCTTGYSGIEAAWAGGENGRVVIDQLLPHIKVLYNIICHTAC